MITNCSNLKISKFTLSSYDSLLNIFNHSLYSLEQVWFTIEQNWTESEHTQTALNKQWIFSKSCEQVVNISKHKWTYRVQLWTGGEHFKTRVNMSIFVFEGRCTKKNESEHLPKFFVFEKEGGGGLLKCT